MLPGQQAHPNSGGSASQLDGPPQGREHPLKQPVCQLRQGIELRLPWIPQKLDSQQHYKHKNKTVNNRQGTGDINR